MKMLINDIMILFVISNYSLSYKQFFLNKT
jgi:hypothetical protein